MKNINNLQQTDFQILKNRLEERLKIVDSQRSTIRRNKSNLNRFKKILLFSFLFLLSVISFYGYQEYRKKIIEQRQKLKNKIAFFKDQKFRDSVNLLAMNMEIEDRVFKKMEDSIQLEVTKKWYQLITENGLPTTDNKAQIRSNKNIVRTTKYNKEQEITSFLNNEVLNDYKELETKKSISFTHKIKKDILTNNAKKDKLDTKITVFAVFPGCEYKSDKRTCFNVKIDKYIRRHINKKVFKKSGVGQVNVFFTISINGLVSIVKITGAINEIIKKEVIRVIESLPRFKPALNKEDIPIPILYNLAINI